MPKTREIRQKRQCAHCEEWFEVVHREHRNYAQRFCSRDCGRERLAMQQRAAWPDEATMRRHVGAENLSDAKIGEIYGHSYEWARRVRSHYKIPAVPKPPHREVKHGRFVGAGKWGIAQKGESRCRACGAGASGTGVLQRVHLHHAIPKSMCKATKTDLRNGIPLCWACHSGWHDRRIVIYRDVFTVEEWKFLTEVELLGQVVEAWLDMHYPDRGRPFREMSDTPLSVDYGPKE